MALRIRTGSGQPRIMGHFGEWLVCNWLARSGFEVAVVDHTGIDLIAFDKTAGHLGITVKSRLRRRGEEKQSVTIFGDPVKNERRKLTKACKSFRCKPWIAVYVERADSGDLYLTSLSHYDQLNRDKQGGKVSNWSMADEPRKIYEGDLNVKHIHVDFKPTHWWGVDKGS